jgi:hypothetical protein
MARPTDYSKEILDKAKVYLEVLPEDEVVHSIEGLSLYVGIARSTIYEWVSQKDKKEFSDIVSNILAKQGKTLINQSLNNKFNASISKMMLSKHGYVEKQETDHTTNGKDIGFIPIEKQEAINKALEDLN